MSSSEKEQHGLETSISVEQEENTPFKISVATFNVGNNKRGLQGLPHAIERMVQFSQNGPGIIGFQEIPPESATALKEKLPNGWDIRKFNNPTDPDLGMAIVYDASRLVLQNADRFPLQQIPAWHRIYEIPRREQPLQREAQIFHFSLREDPSVHIVLANAHLSVKGYLTQRQKEMTDVMEHLQAFMHHEQLVDTKTDQPLTNTSVAAYVIGDFNTPGRVGSERNKRQIEGLGLSDWGFKKLNDLLEPTSNALSSILHKAHDVMGDSVFELAGQMGENARKTLRRQKILSTLIDIAQQHRDHIFGKLYGLEESEESENMVFSPPEHPRDSDHFMVFAGLVLQKHPKSE